MLACIYDHNDLYYCVTSRPKTQFMDFSFEQNAEGNRPQVKILGEEVDKGHSPIHGVQMGVNI